MTSAGVLPERTLAKCLVSEQCLVRQKSKGFPFSSSLGGSRSVIFGGERPDLVPENTQRPFGREHGMLTRTTSHDYSLSIWSHILTLTAFLMCGALLSAQD